MQCLVIPPLGEMAIVPETLLIQQKKVSRSVIWLTVILQCLAGGYPILFLFFLP